MMNTTTNTKVTYSTALSEVIAILTALRDNLAYDPVLDLNEVINKVDALKAQFDKRATAERKPTKKQGENEGIKIEILDFLRGTKGAKCGDIAAAMGISGQKCSALLSQLVKTGEVVKTEEKRVSLFTLADSDNSVQALPGELDA